MSPNWPLPVFRALARVIWFSIFTHFVIVTAIAFTCVQLPRHFGECFWFDKMLSNIKGFKVWVVNLVSTCRKQNRPLSGSKSTYLHNFVTAFIVFVVFFITANIPNRIESPTTITTVGCGYCCGKIAVAYLEPRTGRNINRNTRETPDLIPRYHVSPVRACVSTLCFSISFSSSSSSSSPFLRRKRSYL